MTEDERALLHNVTSGLYNRDGVKAVIDSAIAAVCESLNVPVPEKGKKPAKDKKKQQGDDAEAESAAVPGVKDGAVTAAEYDEDVTDFEGFESDVDEPGPVVGEPDSEAEAEEEDEFSQYDHLLGSSSEYDDDEEEDLSRWEKYRGTEKVNLDDISVSGSDAEPGLASFDEDEDDESDDQKAPSLSPEPKPKKSKAAKPAARPTDSTFLPSLMGGYISGSESASDVDVEPAKKRRGQRARQAIWEKKFGAKAKHLNQPGKKKQGRDSGWDMKRGAVDGDDGGRRTPWKKGVSNPFARNGGGDDGHGGPRQEVQRPPPKRDDEGVLHPSWEARKKSKDALKTAAFSGQKVVFD